MDDNPKKDPQGTDPAIKPPPEHRWDDLSCTHPVSVVPLDPDGEVVPRLIVISGPEVGQSLSVTRTEARIGRTDDADLCIPDSSVSRYHASVFLDQNSRCRLRDLGSTNGTFVNGRRIQDTELSGGDRIQLGKRAILKLEFHGSIENELHEQLYQAGTRDALTNTYNRRYLDQHLEADFRLSVRHEEVLSVVVVDIDHFKQVNDTHGHLAGDTVLKGLAKVLAERVREEDILARYGGEEFVLILRRTGAAGALALAESIRTRVEKAEFSFKEMKLKITVSAGLATLEHPPRFDNALELLAVADKALYRAKSEGRNRVIVAGPNELTP